MKNFTDYATASEPLLGVYAMFPSTLSAHIIGNSGFDWVLIDMEHSPLSASKATAMVHAVANSSHNKTLSFIRIPSHGVEYVKWALDSGAAGLVVPMVQSEAEVKDIIRHARYPPQGQRSFGPFHAPYANIHPDSTMEKYFTRTSKEIAVIPMIESSQGLERAEEILAVPGLNGVFIGPVDLRLSMGLSGPHGEEKEYLEALRKLASVAKQNNLSIGIFLADMSLLARFQQLGYSFFLVGGDLMCLASGLESSLNIARSHSAKI
jgi:2-keto-3-deoxy-L-rhamnonate aldolase RhmA